jgi:uroporphyrinogen decarboxylase
VALMSKKDDMRAALERRQPVGAVPLWELEFHAWDKAWARVRPRETDRQVVLGEAFCALSPTEQECALHANAEIMLSVAEELDFAALTVPNHYWEIAPGAPAYYWLPPEARFRQIEILHQAGSHGIMLVGGSGGVMAMPGASSYVEFSYRLFDAPEEIDRQAAQTLEHGVEMARRLRDLGIEAVFTASDIADNRGVFFNPAQMERFILPYLRRWAEAVKGMGLYAILHTDGDINSCLEDLAESGIDALQAIDPVAGMEMRSVKDAVGDRLCLCGNVDCGLLVMGTPGPDVSPDALSGPGEVYAATRDLLLDCKAGGGLVLGASNAVQPEVPIENYMAMIEAWREHGRY